MKAIFSALLEQMRAGRDVALCTLIAHAGSVPRGMGSQMLLNADGLVCGTIGGGVGEKEMIAFGLDLLSRGACGMHTYALHGREGQRLGSVCGGDITVYFQYIAAGDALWYALAEGVLERIEMRRGGWLIQRLNGGGSSLVDRSGELAAGDPVPEMDALCRPVSVCTQAYFAMPLYVGERAVLFGAGHCAQALAPLLASVGFRVTVYDDRPELACSALFPQAERIICAPYDCIADHIALDEDDYVVAMTSTHVSDLCIQNQVLRADHAYVGMLGSRPKRAFVHGKLLEYGIEQAMIDRVHTPIGLNIKAVTPAEIAVSIAGEMILVRAQNREKANNA